jgi:hydrogenase maturation protease
LPGDEARGEPPAGGDARPLNSRPHPGSGVLVVGYGNPLRGDDGLGPGAAALLADDPRLRGAQVLARHQLTPELASDFAEARLVILIDVNVVDRAGVVSVRRLDETPSPESGSSHHTSPMDLAGLARELWGASPAVFIVSVGAASLEVGEGLSAPVQKSLPAVVEAVVAIMAEHGGAASPG